MSLHGEMMPSMTLYFLDELRKSFASSTNTTTEKLNQKRQTHRTEKQTHTPEEQTQPDPYITEDRLIQPVLANNVHPNVCFLVIIIVGLSFIIIIVVIAPRASFVKKNRCRY